MSRTPIRRLLLRNGYKLRRNVEPEIEGEFGGNAGESNPPYGRSRDAPLVLKTKPSTSPGSTSAGEFAATSLRSQGPGGGLWEGCGAPYACASYSSCVAAQEQAGWARVGDCGTCAWRYLFDVERARGAVIATLDGLKPLAAPRRFTGQDATHEIMAQLDQLAPGEDTGKNARDGPKGRRSGSR